MTILVKKNENIPFVLLDDVKDIFDDVVENVGDDLIVLSNYIENINAREAPVTC